MGGQLLAWNVRQISCTAFKELETYTSKFHELGNSIVWRLLALQAGNAWRSFITHHMKGNCYHWLICSRIEGTLLFVIGNLLCHGTDPGWVWYRHDTWAQGFTYNMTAFVHSKHLSLALELRLSSLPPSLPPSFHPSLPPTTEGCQPSLSPLFFVSYARLAMPTTPSDVCTYRLHIHTQCSVGRYPGKKHTLRRVTSSDPVVATDQSSCVLGTA